MIRIGTMIAIEKYQKIMAGMARTIKPNILTNLLFSFAR